MIKMQIGAQFYTIRDFCKNLNDFSESLKRVADIGYKTVQISGTCAYEPQWLAQELNKNGLKCVITHIPADRLTQAPANVAAEHKIFGCDYVGLGSYGFEETKIAECYQNFLKAYVPVAKTLHENGKYFMYHNHAMEFLKFDGKIIIEHMAQDIPAEIMGFILDTYWVQRGGGDPAYWIERLSGRVPCIHLKDFAVGEKMAVIGEGNINFDRVFEKAEAAGTKYMLVEQDNCNGENPFDCLKRSYNNLKAMGFE